MSQYSLDVNRSSPIVNESDHAILISSYIEHGPICNEIRRAEHASHVAGSAPIHRFDRVSPVQERRKCLRVPLYENPHCPAADHSHLQRFPYRELDVKPPSKTVTAENSLCDTCRRYMAFSAMGILRIDKRTWQPWVQNTRGRKRVAQ
jgi:hypothetical protein